MSRTSAALFGAGAAASIIPSTIRLTAWAGPDSGRWSERQSASARPVAAGREADRDRAGQLLRRGLHVHARLLALPQDEPGVAVEHLARLGRHHAAHGAHQRTRWLVVNSPGNPTGATYTPAEWRALADVLPDHPRVLVMTDDIYEHIRFGAEGPAPHLLNAAPELKDRTLAINGVSKTYAMTGWWIGWAAGPRDLIEALGTLLSQASGNACSVSQAAAVEALNGDQPFVAESVATYRSRRDRMVARVNAIPGLGCTPPEGAFYLYVGCEGLIGRRTPDGRRLATDDDVVMHLLENAGVALVPGAAYGLSPCFRLSNATSAANLDGGAERIARAVAALR